MPTKQKIKVLVTGGAGYIGSHAIVELLAAGYEVVSVDNFSNSTAKTFGRIKKITGVKVKNHAVDVCDTLALQKVFQKEKNIFAVIHFAAFKSVPESIRKPRAYYANNVGGLVSLLEVMDLFDVRNIIFSSSCAVYGNIRKLPVTEKTKLQKPTSPYAASKLLGERLIADLDQGGSIILRYFNPIGAHKSGLLGEALGDGLVSHIMQIAKKEKKELVIFGKDYDTRDGTCVRDYVHVSDIARAHVDALKFLLKQKKSVYEIFNLGSGKGVTVLELVKAFEKANGIKVPYRFGLRRAGDIPAVYSDCSKAKRVLRWKPKYIMKDVMQSVWKWEE